MNNRLVEVPQKNTLTYNKEQVDLIKNTVAKGATEDELNMFLYLSKQYGLDPFKREIWFTKYGNQTNIMTSRDGYLKYAQQHTEFEGLISFVVHEGDAFEIDAAEYKISHKFGAKRGKIVGAWARCDRKGKRPFISYVEFTEYNQNNNIWKKYPSAMIQKVAEVFVLKRAFGINGLVTKEEMSDETQAYTTDLQKPEEPQVQMMEKDQKTTIWNIAQSKGMSLDELKQFTMKNLQTPLANLNYEQANELLEIIATYEKEPSEPADGKQVDLEDVERETSNEFAVIEEE